MTLNTKWEKMVAALVSTHMRIGLTNTSAVQFVFRKWYCIQWVGVRLWAAESPTFSAFTYHYNHMTSLCVWCMYSSHENLLINYDSANFVPYNQQCFVHRSYCFGGTFGGGGHATYIHKYLVVWILQYISCICCVLGMTRIQTSGAVMWHRPAPVEPAWAWQSWEISCMLWVDRMGCPVSTTLKGLLPFLLKFETCLLMRLVSLHWKILCVCVFRQSWWHFALDNLWKMCPHL